MRAARHRTAAIFKKPPPLCSSTVFATELINRRPGHSTAAERALVHQFCEAICDNNVAVALHLVWRVHAWEGNAPHAALCRAASLGHADIVRAFCSPPVPADWFAVGVVNDWAIRGAAQHNRIEVVRVLLRLPKVYGIYPSPALLPACSYGHLSIVRLLCADGNVFPAFANNLPLCTAVKMGHFNIARFLCELPAHRGVHAHAFDQMALRMAIKFGKLDIVHYLLHLPAPHKVRITMERDNHRLLLGAVWGDSVHVLQFLCGFGTPRRRPCNPAAHDNELLHKATQWRAIHCVRFLLSQEQPRRQIIRFARKSDRQNSHGSSWRELEDQARRTMLLMAAKQSWPEMVRFACEELRVMADDARDGEMAQQLLLNAVQGYESGSECAGDAIAIIEYLVHDQGLRICGDNPVHSLIARTQTQAWRLYHRTRLLRLRMLSNMGRVRHLVRSRHSFLPRPKRRRHTNAPHGAPRD